MQYKCNKFSIPNEHNSSAHIDLKNIRSDDFDCNNNSVKKKLSWKKSQLFQDAFSLVFFPTVVIGFWRGAWDTMDYYEKQFFPYRSTIILSAMMCLILERIRSECITKHLKILDDDTKFTKLKKNILLSIFDICYNLANVSFWRVLWGHPEELENGDIDWTPSAYVSVICLIPLIIFRAVRNLVAPPIVIITDSKDFAFNFPTRYRIEGVKEPGLYILDCLFSVLVIGSLVVFVWRGLWVFLDANLYPKDPTASAWASVIIGYAIVGVTFCMQPCMRKACETFKGFWKIAIADCFLFLGFVGTVNVWRGLWLVLDCYFIPENKILSNVLCHLISLVLLIFLNCSNSVLVRGVYIDAEEPGGQCVIFPVYYIRLFIKKQLNRQQHENRGKHNGNLRDKEAIAEESNIIRIIENFEYDDSTILSGHHKIVPNVRDVNFNIKHQKEEEGRTIV